MDIYRRDTAVVFTDPQNEVLSETGQAWPLVRESLAENNTIENMDRLFAAAKRLGFEVFISPHYFYPTDAGWKFNGALEADEAARGFFGRRGILNLDGLAGSGAEWLPRFKPYIEGYRLTWHLGNCFRSARMPASLTSVLCRISTERFLRAPSSASPASVILVSVRINVDRFWSGAV